MSVNQSFRIENRQPTEKEFDEIIELINRTWTDYYYKEGMYYYNRNVLNWYIQSPFQKPDFYFMAFDENTEKLIGFAVLMFKNILIQGEGPFRFVYGSLITTDKEYQKMGLGKAMAKAIQPCYERVGIDGIIFNMEEGSKGIKTLQKERLEQCIPLWTHEHAYIRPLNTKGKRQYMDMKWYEKLFIGLFEGVKDSFPANIRNATKEDIPSIISLLNSYSKENSITRHWDLEEYKQYLENPVFRAKLLVDSTNNNKVMAIISCAVVPFFVQGAIVKLAIFENYNYKDITFQQQKDLIRSLLWDLKKEGVVAASDFGIGYSDPKPLLANSFFKYPRKMTLYILPPIKSNEQLMDKIRKSDRNTYIDIR